MHALETELQHLRLKSKATTPNGSSKDAAFDASGDEHQDDGHEQVAGVCRSQECAELKAESVYLSVGDEWEADEGRAVSEGGRGKGMAPSATGLSMQAELAVLRALVHDLTAKLNAQTPQ